MKNYQFKTHLKNKIFYFSTTTILAISFLTAGPSFAQSSAGQPVNNGAISDKPVGLPMPSLNPSNSTASLPMSNQPMNMNSKSIDGVINNTTSEADKRLSALQINTPVDSAQPPTEKVVSGDLPSVDTSGYGSELQSMSEIQRQIDLLDLKQKQAEAASKLWSTLFNAQAEAGVVDSSSNSNSTLGSMAQTGAIKMSLDKTPKIFSIGCTPLCSANIIIPYVGVENNVHTGETLNNGDKVVSITYDSVMVEDKDGNKKSLQLASTGVSEKDQEASQDSGNSKNPLGMVTPNPPGKSIQ
jgi:hypothetical protein